MKIRLKTRKKPSKKNLDPSAHLTVSAFRACVESDGIGNGHGWGASPQSTKE